MFFGEDFRKKLEKEKIKMEAERDFMMDMTEALGQHDKCMKLLNLEMKAKLKLEKITDVKPGEISEEEKDKKLLFLKQINALLDQFMKGESNE